MNRTSLGLALALALPAMAATAAPAKHEGPLKLPKFVSFGRGNTNLPKGSEHTLAQVKEYLHAHPEVTLLRVEGYYDQRDSSAAAETHAAARALAVGRGLVAAGVDCKRLIPVAFAKGGDMREGGAYATFVNAGLRGKPIGGMKPEAGGKKAGDLCDTSAHASAGSSASPAKQPASGGAAHAASSGITKANDPRLSDARKKFFVELEKRVPSVEGHKSAAGKSNLFDGVAHQVKGTTCGLLPGVLMQRMGVRGVISSYATEGVRTEGQRLGVWVENDGTNLPTPGDIYVLRYPETPNTDSVAHVGVVYDVTDPNRWITADAGQGSREVQEAKLVTRNMKKVDGTHFFLSGPSNTPGDSPLLRRIGGWVNLDALLAKSGKK